MNKRSLFLFAAFGLLASLAFGTPTQAGSVFTYTVSIASDTVTVIDQGLGVGTFSATALSGTQGPDTAPTAPSTAAASDPIGGYNLTYNNLGTFPSSYAQFKGDVVYDVKVTDQASGQSGIFTVTAAFNGVAYTGAGPITPSLTPSAQLVIGEELYRLNAASIGTNVHIPGTTINVGFETSAVPEPASLALLGIGLSGLFTLRRFFKRTSVA